MSVDKAPAGRAATTFWHLGRQADGAAARNAMMDRALALGRSPDLTPAQLAEARRPLLPRYQSFVLPWTPTAKGRPRTVVRDGRPIVYTPHQTRRAEAALQAALRDRGAVLYPARVPLRLTVMFGIAKPVKAPKYLTHSERRPDLTNYLMLLADAGTGILWTDDAQLAELDAGKLYQPAGQELVVVLTVQPIAMGPRAWWTPAWRPGWIE